jgi:molecular chaperone GrpE (heat shock protein)
VGIIDWLRGGAEETGEPRPADGAAATAPKRPEVEATAEAAKPDAAKAERAEKPERAEKIERPRRLPLEGAEAIWNSLVEHVILGGEAIARIEAAAQPLVGMLQATAKANARSDQDRKQQFLELRAHITGETDRLAETLRAQITREAAVEVWRALLPALDEIDHVLREAAALGEARGLESLRLVRRKLRDAMSRLEIEELSVEERVTQFDANFHEGKPHDGDAEDTAALPAGTVVRLERTGYTVGDRVLRCAQVTVAGGK